jgi:cell division protease FtsH
MINEQYERAKQILTEHKDGHAQLAQLLVDREVIFAEDVEKIFGKRPWTSRAEELLEAQMKADAERMAEERARELEAQGKLEAKEAESENENSEEGLVIDSGFCLFGGIRFHLILWAGTRGGNAAGW